MTRTAIVILLAAAAAMPAGCREKAGTGFEDAWLPEEEVRKLVGSLPQVRAWKQQIAGRGFKEVLTVERTPAQCKAAGEVPAWIIKVGYTDGATTADWQRFHINAAGAEVKFWSARQNRYVPLESWGR